MDGNQVPQGLVKKVGEAFERILEEVCLLPPGLTTLGYAFGACSMLDQLACKPLKRF